MPDQLPSLSLNVLAVAKSTCWQFSSKLDLIARITSWGKLPHNRPGRSLLNIVSASPYHEEPGHTKRPASTGSSYRPMHNLS